MEGKLAILAALRDADEPLGLREIATRSGVPYGSVRVLLTRMVFRGNAARVGRGLYVLGEARRWGGQIQPATGSPLARLLDAQGGRCYLCEEPLALAVAVVEHDHTCSRKYACGGCLRGLAHQGCNIVIGKAEDDPQILRSMADGDTRLLRIADNLEQANQRVRKGR